MDNKLSADPELPNSELPNPESRNAELLHHPGVRLPPLSLMFPTLGHKQTIGGPSIHHAISKGLSR